MTDLQASLIAIGGAIVVGVISYNKWQEHKAKKIVEGAFPEAHDDVLMRTDAVAVPEAPYERQEPMFGGGHEVPAHEAQTHAAGSADDLPPSDTASPTAPPAAPRAATPRELPLDDMVDCLIPLALEGVVRGEKILPALQTLRHVGNKPVHFIGQPQDGEWEPVMHGRVYAALMAGVQLANRGSVLNEIEYSELVMRLRQVADDIGAEPDVPDMANVMTAARGLHQFVAEFDAQLSVNVQSNGAPWAISTLLAALERHGFDLRPDGRLVMPDGDSGNLFSLSTNVTLAAESTNRLTLLLDVPCVAQARDGFGAMSACARMLATRLDGTVVDDAGQPLSDEAIAQIGSQVVSFYGEMEAAEIPAGSPRALRLFS